MDEKELRKIIEEEREKSAAQIVEMVRTTLAEDARPKMRISPEEGLDLLGRAGAISAEVKGKTADLIMGGKTKDEVTRFLFEEYGKKTKPDAVDPGAGGGDGTGLPAKPGAQAPIRSLKDISDDEFIAGITSPSGLSL